MNPAGKARSEPATGASMAEIPTSESFAMPATVTSPFPTRFKNAALVLLLGSFLGAALYLIVCLACQLALSVLVPLAASDYLFSSWLIVPPLFGGTQFFALIMCVYAFWILLVPRRVPQFVLALFVAAISASVGSQAVSLRSAVLHGEAKIGCFNYSGKACLKMLGLPSVAAPYDLDEIPTPQVRNSPIMLSAIVRAPFDLARVDEMRGMVAAQRTELAAHQGK